MPEHAEAVSLGRRDTDVLRSNLNQTTVADVIGSARPRSLTFFVALYRSLSRRHTCISPVPGAMLDVPTSWPGTWTVYYVLTSHHRWYSGQHHALGGNVPLLATPVSMMLILIT